MFKPQDRPDCHVRQLVSNEQRLFFGLILGHTEQGMHTENLGVGSNTACEVAK